MIDHALSRPEVDPARLALYGISFGGYFATRAATHDRRVKALVANSPIPDLHTYMVGFVGHETAANPPQLTLAQVDPGVELSFKASCRRFGVDSMAEWLARLRDFRTGDALENIRCPSLALVGKANGRWL